MECRKCPYFQKIKNMMHGTSLIVGFCKLRQRHISDETVGAQVCKDRAIIEIDEKIKKISSRENEEEFVKRAAFGG